MTTKTIIKFILDGSWSEGFATFFAYIALVLYVVGLLQWLIIQLPKNGRYAGKF
jgi:hypothetical protein